MKATLVPNALEESDEELIVHRTWAWITFTRNPDEGDVLVQAEYDSGGDVTYGSVTVPTVDSPVELYDGNTFSLTAEERAWCLAALCRQGERS
jgi:hypothetical protein